MFKSQFYLYFSDSKRKRPENFHLYWLIYMGDFTEYFRAFLQNKGKPKCDKLLFELTAGFIYVSANFLQWFISFWLLLTNFVVNRFEKLGIFASIISTILTVFKSRDSGYLIMFLVCARGKSRLHHVEVDEQQNGSFTLNLWHAENCRPCNESVSNIFPIFSEYLGLHHILHRVAGVNCNWRILPWFSTDIVFNMY